MEFPKILSAGCTLAYDVLSPTANFIFNILANRDVFQRLVDEGIRLTPDVPIGKRTATSKGNRVFRVEAPAGPFEVVYHAQVEVNRPVVPIEVRADNPGRLPLSILTYMLPSRYCESDRFTQPAWDLFGKIPQRADQVREICRWIDATLVYTAGATDFHTSALDAWQLKKTSAAITFTLPPLSAVRSTSRRATSTATSAAARVAWNRWIFTPASRPASVGIGISLTRPTASRPTTSS